MAKKKPPVKKISAEDAKRRYRVTCEGQYFGVIDQGRNHAVKNYKLEVVLDGRAKHAGLLSVIRNAFLTKRIGQDFLMEKLYPDWKKYRTHEITKVIEIDETGKPLKQVREIALMNRAQIVTYIESRGLEITHDLYPDVSALRQAVKDYSTNYEAFMKLQSTKEQSSGTWLRVMKSAKEANRHLFDAVEQNTDTSFDEVEVVPQTQDETGIRELDEPVEMDEVLAGL